MCEIFLSGDPIRFERKSRSMRIDGHVTSVCLEGIFWELLGHIVPRSADPKWSGDKFELGFARCLYKLFEP